MISKPAYETIIYLRKKKLNVLGCGLFALLIYILFFFFFPKEHESYAVIYSSNKNKTETQLSNANTLQDVGESYTIINWVYSSQLINHLIGKFNLLSHYGIDQKKTDSYSICFNRITKHINVNLTPYGAVKISVSDKNRYFAADVANEILKQIDNLNKQKVIENRKNIIREYDFLLKEFSNDVTSQQDSIKKLLDTFSDLTNRAGISFEKKEITINSLTNASRNYEKLSSDWLTLRKVHLLSLKEIEEFNLPNFVIVQFALPELEESLFSFTNIGFMILTFIVGIWLSIAFLIFYHNYYKHLILVIRNNNLVNTEPTNNSKNQPVFIRSSKDQDAEEMNSYSKPN